MKGPTFFNKKSPLKGELDFKEDNCMLDQEGMGASTKCGGREKPSKEGNADVSPPNVSYTPKFLDKHTGGIGSPAKQTQLDAYQQQQQIASNQVDLEEKQFQANTKKNKRDHQNRINPITGTPI